MFKSLGKHPATFDTAELGFSGPAFPSLNFLTGLLVQQCHQ